MSELNEDYWTNRYHDENTPWNIGYASTPLKEYVDALKNKQIKILIPGAGNGYEGEYLFEKGFSQVYIIDIALPPLQNLSQRSPDFPEAQLLHGDFFELEDQYDLILEQTFFCALHPSQRPSYMQKMKELLKPEGRLAGVLFVNTLLDRENPPYGIREQAMHRLLKSYFHIYRFAPCTNSIPPRRGSEYFFEVGNSGH